MATTALAMGQSIGLNLWDTTTGRQVFSARLPTNWITAIAFSPDGHRLAAATTAIDVTAGIAGRKVPSEIHIRDATPVDDSAVLQASESELKGTWIVRSAELNGQAARSSVGDRFTFAGDQVTIETKVRKTEPVGFRLDATQNPPQIDVEGEPASRGIYKLQDDLLRRETADRLRFPAGPAAQVTTRAGRAVS